MAIRIIQHPAAARIAIRTTREPKAALFTLPEGEWWYVCIRVFLFRRLRHGMG